MMLNEAMFAGYGGWVLKPAGYLSTSGAEEARSAIPPKTLDLSIEFIAGQDIPLPHDHESTKTFKPFVKVEIHVERHQGHTDAAPGGTRAKDGEYKRRTKVSRTQNPDFHKETIAFHGVPGVVPELSFVR